jgi:uncharacterized protein YhfF
MRNDIESFWQAARRAVPSLPASGYKVRTFGRSADMSEVLIALIASGQKTGTFALEEEYRREPGLRPSVGDHFVVTAFEGQPALVYRITEVETVPFGGIGPAHVAVEGPNARQVEIWRQIHWPYWGGILREWGQEPSEDMPVVFQKFELLYPLPQ